MKLKYYMRGLGLGIILTTLIFAIGVKQEKLSDKEIIKKAKALGMVMEDGNKNLEEVLDSINPSITPSVMPSITPTAEPTAEPSVEPTIEPTAQPTVEPTAQPTVEPTVQPTVEPTKSPEPSPTGTPNDEEQANTEISFVIKSGMSSGKVATMLEDIGLIDDGEDFNQYIVNVNKASIIRVGSYSIRKGASYEEIVTMITSK